MSLLHKCSMLRSVTSLLQANNTDLWVKEPFSAGCKDFTVPSVHIAMLTSELW